MKVTVEYKDRSLYDEPLKEKIEKAAERIFGDGLFITLEGILVKIRVDSDYVEKDPLYGMQ